MLNHTNVISRVHFIMGLNYMYSCYPYSFDFKKRKRERREDSSEVGVFSVCDLVRFYQRLMLKLKEVPFVTTND